MKRGIEFDRYTAAAVIFLSLVFFIGGLTAWSGRSDIKRMAFEFSGFKGTVEKAETLYNEKLGGLDAFVEIWSKLQNALGTRLFDDAEYGFIIKDSQGKLHFPVEKTDISEYAEETVKFAEELSGMEAPFVYVQAPDKMLSGYTVYPDGGYNHSNENADAFLSVLQKNGVDTLDLRELIISENLDRESLFYYTDHHWTTKTAFWAYVKTVDYLNDEYGLSIDSAGFYRDIGNYTATEYEDCFLGSLGRRVGKSAAGLDDYTFIEPDFETDYTIYNAVISESEPVFSGSFRQSIAKEDILENKDIETNRHAAYFEWDYGNLIIKNNTVDNGIRILLIKDSFSLPLAAFLSTCVSELHIVDLRDAGVETPAEYVKKYDFDAVVMLYNTEAFTAPMFDLNEKSE